MFISQAWAGDVASTTTAAASEGGIGASLLPILLIFVIFYFLLIRPQSKRLKEHQAMVSGLNKGDKVVTSGGLIATVSKVEENELVLEISEGVKVRAVRSSVSMLMNDPNSVAEKTKKAA